MGDIVGGITDAIGLTDHKGERKAREAAAKAQSQSVAMSKEQIELMREELEFQKDQYNDWKDIYGDLQDNLGDYYKNLDGDELVVKGLQAQQREFQAATRAVRRDAAQRGIKGSGLEFAATTNAAFQNAEARARIRASADEQAAQQKLGFLGVGLGQGTQMLGIINSAASNANNAYNTGVQSSTNMARSFLGQQTQLSTNNTNAMGEIVGSFLGNQAG